MSGHSKWHSIKHKKGALDAKRGKIFTKIIREMSIAARIGGGDPASNPRLRTAVDKAKSVNMPADNSNRTVSEIRHIFTKNGGNLSTVGSVSYMFKPRGYISIATAKIDEEKLMDIALEAGADDIQT